MSSTLHGIGKGRIVHYVDKQGVHSAAMVVSDAVVEDTGGERWISARLQVFTELGNTYFIRSSFYDETMRNNTFHFPERIG